MLISRRGQKCRWTIFLVHSSTLRVMFSESLLVQECGRGKSPCYNIILFERRGLWSGVIPPFTILSFRRVGDCGCLTFPYNLLLCRKVEGCGEVSNFLPRSPPLGELKMVDGSELFPRSPLLEGKIARGTQD